MTDDYTHGHHQITNIKTRLIMFFADKNGEAQYSQQKQDLELIVAHIMSSLLQNSDLYEHTIQVWPKLNPLWLYSEGDK